MSGKEPHRSIPVFTQTAFPEQPELDRWHQVAEGFDLFTRHRGPLGGDYQGYREGDFPVTEEAFQRLIFLPMLSDPVPEAVDRIVDMLKRGIQSALESSRSCP